MKKKILLGLGSLVAVVAPVASVVSCGEKKAHLNTPTKVGSSHIEVVLNLDTVNIHPTTGTTELNKAINDAVEPTMATIKSKIKRAEKVLSDASFLTQNEEKVDALQNMVNTFYEIGVVTTTYTITYKGVSNHFDIVSHFENLCDIDGINSAWANGSAIQSRQTAEASYTTMLEENKQMWTGIITSQAFINFKNFVGTDHGKVILMKANALVGLNELALSATIDEIASNLNAAINMQRMMAGLI